MVLDDRKGCGADFIFGLTERKARKNIETITTLDRSELLQLAQSMQLGEGVE